MNLETQPAPKKRLTRFICQELLYEFVTGRLDRERQAEVDEYLSGCRDSQREFERLKRGLRYTSQAAHLKVEEQLRRSLLEFEPQWKKTVAAWTLQSSQRGWKLLPYVIVVLALILGLFVTKPWSGTRNDVLLVEQMKAEPDLIPASPEAAVEPPAAAPLLETNKPMPPPSPLAAIVPDVKKPPPEAPQPLAPPSGAEAKAAAAPAESAIESGDSAPGAGGTVQRGDIEVADFANDWPAIRDKVLALGGKVAGNVELGWQRKEGEAYFHFSLPESNQAELELFLKTFGPVRFHSEPAPRVMPEGQIRIILSVKDGGSHEDSAEAP